MSDIIVFARFVNVAEKFLYQMLFLCVRGESGIGVFKNGGTDGVAGEFCYVPVEFVYDCCSHFWCAVFQHSFYTEFAVF